MPGQWKRDWDDAEIVGVYVWGGWRGYGRIRSPIAPWLVIE